jgi:transposase-like protein
MVAGRWHLRHGLSYHDVEELLAEHGIEVDPSRSLAGAAIHPTVDQAAHTGRAAANQQHVCHLVEAHSHAADRTVDYDRYSSD